MLASLLSKLGLWAYVAVFAFGAASTGWVTYKIMDGVIAHEREAVLQAELDARAKAQVEEAKLAKDFAARLKAAEEDYKGRLTAAEAAATQQASDLQAALNEARKHDATLNRCLALRLPDGVRRAFP